jgi:ADP-heptose:LPS heptosyltransferase
MDKYSIAIIEGGAGKSVMFSAVAQSIKKAHPDRKLFVFTAYPEVLLNCQAIDRVYRLGQVSYFYDDFIKDKDVEFFCEEPYKSRSFLKEQKHIIESWCDCINVAYEGAPPTFNLTPVEIELAYKRIAHLQKPLFVIQPFGGANNRLPYSWNRDIPVKQAHELVNA